MLLIPIGFGILIGNIPFNMEAGLKVGIYEEGSVLNILYQGVTSGWYPPLIFLGIGAMTDFSALISNPKLMLIGAAAQFGIFGAYMIALAMGFDPMQTVNPNKMVMVSISGPRAVSAKRRVTPLSFNKLPKKSIPNRGRPDGTRKQVSNKPMIGNITFSV